MEVKGQNELLTVEILILTLDSKDQSLNVSEIEQRMRRETYIRQ